MSIATVLNVAQIAFVSSGALGLMILAYKKRNSKFLYFIALSIMSSVASIILILANRQTDFVNAVGYNVERENLEEGINIVFSILGSVAALLSYHMINRFDDQKIDIGFIGNVIAMLALILTAVSMSSSSTLSFTINALDGLLSVFAIALMSLGLLSLFRRFSQQRTIGALLVIALIVQVIIQMFVPILNPQKIQPYIFWISLFQFITVITTIALLYAWMSSNLEDRKKSFI
jgi:hypothetical protein